MTNPCPICGNPRMYSLTCKKCKSTWKTAYDFQMDGYRRYYRASLSFRKDAKTAANLFDEIELLHRAWRYLKEAERVK